MKLENYAGIHTLIKTDNTMVNVNDGEIIKYQGIFYKKKQDSTYAYCLDETPTDFIGKVFCMKYYCYSGIVGIYVVPLYMFLNGKWNKITNFTHPLGKYFLYPHLLTLPNSGYFKRIESLDTVESVNLPEFEKNMNYGEIELDLGCGIYEHSKL